MKIQQIFSRLIEVEKQSGYNKSDVISRRGSSMKLKKFEKITFIVLTVVFALFIGTMFILTDHFITDNFRKSAVNDIVNESMAKTEAVKEYFEHQADIMKGISYSPLIYRYLKTDLDNEVTREEVNEYINKVYKNLNNWESLYIALQSTEILVHTNEDAVGMITRDADGARALVNEMYKRHDVYVYGTMISPATGKGLLSMYCPVYQNNAIIGYIGGGPYADDLREFLGSLHNESAENRYCIVDADDATYLLTEDDDMVRGEIEDEVVLDAIGRINQDRSIDMYDYDYTDSEGHQYVVIYNYLREYHWALVSVYEKGDIAAGLRGARIIIAVLGLAAVIIFVVIIYISYKRIVKAQEGEDLAIKEARAKTSFLANMSHEIRTPMNAVIGMTDVLSSTALNEKQSKYVKCIKDSGTTLVSLINDILDYSKIDSGNIVLVPRNYNLADMLNSVKTTIESKMGDKKLEFKVVIDKNIPNVLNGDDIRIRQILINLLSNSVKFTDKGKIHLYTVINDRTDEEIELVFQVKDTGIGIARENLNKIFDKFKIFDVTKSYGKEGNGLGLAICKQLVTLMGGEILVDSEVGKGTTFTVKLKQKIIDGSPIKIPTKEEYSEAEKKEETFIIPDVDVLIVDDNKTNLLVARGLFKPLKAKVDTALSGAEGIEMCKHKKYDLILMDHMMPEMDGIEAIRRIREIEEFDGYYKNVVFLAFTANAMSEAQELFKSVGVEGFLAKPLDVKRLREAIRTYMPRNRLKYEEE